MPLSLETRALICSKYVNAVYAGVRYLESGEFNWNDEKFRVRDLREAWDKYIDVDVTDRTLGMAIERFFRVNYRGAQWFNDSPIALAYYLTLYKPSRRPDGTDELSKRERRTMSAEALQGKLLSLTAAHWLAGDKVTQAGISSIQRLNQCYFYGNIDLSFQFSKMVVCAVRDALK
jgi:hypothetical protein